MLRSLLAALAAAILLLGLLRYDVSHRRALLPISRQLQPLARTMKATVDEVAAINQALRLPAPPSLPSADSSLDPSSATSGNFSIGTRPRNEDVLRGRWRHSPSARYVWMIGNGGRDVVRRKVHSGCTRGNITCERAEVVRLTRESEWHQKRNRLYRKRQEEQRKARKRALGLAVTATNSSAPASDTSSTIPLRQRARPPSLQDTLASPA